MESMLPMCSPSWQRSLGTNKDPTQEMWSLLKGRTPVEYQVIAISGTINDLSRTVTVDARIKKSTSQEARYQMKMVLMKENDEWYVDPRSLESHETTPTPSLEPSLPTQPATPPTGADASTVLYYNPSGGVRYHVDPYCKSANEKYLPFKGTFTYGQLKETPYSNLEPCPYCSAPRKPK